MTPDDRTRSDELAQLLGRVALRDHAAFEQVYRRSCERLLGLAFGILGRRDRAEDVLQEAYMNVWQGAAGYNPAIAPPMTWLINIVRNKAIDRLRSGKTERERTVEWDDDALAQRADPGLQPPALLEDRLLRHCIGTCMAELQPAQRQALALAYFRGQVHSEIAETLGAPLGTVKAWVRRGSDQLRVSLRAAGITGSAQP